MNLIDEAAVFAVNAHSGQTRKMAGTPYILHPMEVASVAGTMTNEPEIIAAALLHDTVEDCGVDPKEIKRLFGARVSALVQSETEDKLSDRPPQETWTQRKEESLIILEHTNDIGVKILWLSDKLSNIRSFYREHQKRGDEMFLSFNQKDPKKQEWYYRRIAACLTELSDFEAYKEFLFLIDGVFGAEN